MHPGRRRLGSVGVSSSRGRSGVILLAGLGVAVLFSVVSYFLDSALATGGTTSIQWWHLLFDWLAAGVFGLGLSGAVLLAQRRTERAAEAQRAVEELRRRLAGTERAQATWVLGAAMLHELRNPLHTLGLALEQLELGSVGPEQAPLLAVARDTVTLMNARFTKLRELSGSPSPERERYALGELLAQLVEELRVLASELRLELEGSVGVVVEGDPELTRAAVEHVVLNAVDALRGAGQRGTIRLRLRVEPEQVLLDIDNDGPPIPTAKQAALFEPLHSSKEHGLGLGLAIARALTRSQGGELSLLRSDAEHTTFRLRLPLRGQGGDD